jgi:hypothetical protein
MQRSGFPISGKKDMVLQSWSQELKNCNFQLCHPPPSIQTLIRRFNFWQTSYKHIKPILQKELDKLDCSHEETPEQLGGFSMGETEKVSWNKRFWTCCAKKGFGCVCSKKGFGRSVQKKDLDVLCKGIQACTWSTNGRGTNLTCDHTKSCSGNCTMLLSNIQSAHTTSLIIM